MEWSDKYILLVEDDHSSLMYYREILKGRCAALYETNNGVDAFIECIKNPNVNLVLMDIKIPRLDGLESTRLIKKYRNDIKIILQTGCMFRDNDKVALKFGGDEILIKPIVPQQLIDAINKNMDELAKIKV